MKACHVPLSHSSVVMNQIEPDLFSVGRWYRTVRLPVYLKGGHF